MAGRPKKYGTRRTRSRAIVIPDDLYQEAQRVAADLNRKVAFGEIPPRAEDPYTPGEVFVRAAEEMLAQDNRNRIIARMREGG